MPNNHLFKDPVDSLSQAIEAIGGAKWTIATTYEYDEEHIKSLVTRDDLNLGELLILSDKKGDHHNGAFSSKWKTVFSDTKWRIHGKIILSRGTKGIVLSVSSANLTGSGFGGQNIEVFNIYVQPVSDGVISPNFTGMEISIS